MIDKLEKDLIDAVSKISTSDIKVKGHTVRVIKREFRKLKR